MSSSYQVIARRFRPDLFADVVGQEHVTRVLEGAIKSERVAHAYLFCGPRGVGKTSTARILARALNCASGPKPTPTPCNSCHICEEITAGRNLDTIEIDGASTRGIDNVRELRESARYSPAGGRYKVYVIDEVHMLTSEAFNALLKTLEEPPRHVVFIFATTEPQKVPATILSRCQRFDFRLLKVQEIADQLEAIVKVEKYKIDRAALMVIARRGQGSMRDAESLLDQVLVAVERRKKVTREMVEQLLGLTSTVTFLTISDCLRRQDAAGALTVLCQSLAAGNHLEELIGGLIDHLRNLLLLAVSPDLAPATGLGEDVIEQCQEQLDGWSRGDLTRMLEIAAAAAGQMRRSDFPQLHLEMALVQMAELPSTADLKQLIARLGAGGGGDPDGGGGGRQRPPASSASSGGRRAGSSRAPTRRQGAAASGMAPPASFASALDAPSLSAAPAAMATADMAAPDAHAATATATMPEPAADAAVPVTDVPRAAPVVPAAEMPVVVRETAAAPDDRSVPATEPAAATGAVDPADLAGAWARIIDRLKDRKAYLASLLSESQAPRLQAGVFSLAFTSDQVFHRDQVVDARNRDLVLEELRAEFGAGTRFEVVTAKAPAAEQSAAPPPRPQVPLEYSGELEGLVNRFDGVILPESGVREPGTQEGSR